MSNASELKGIWMLLLAALALMPSLGNATTTRSERIVDYYHVDALGSVVATSDASGKVVTRRAYEPYGSSLDGLWDGPGYTGHVGDANTGLTYLQQRYYDPQVGLFLSADPVATLEDPLSAFNRYRYGNGNPYRFSDPDGRRSQAFADLREMDCNAKPECRFALEGEGESKWTAVKSRLGLSGDLTKNGNVLDFGSLFHDLVHPAMEMPGGRGIKLVGVGFFALKLGPSVGSLAGLGNIGSHGVVDSSIALSSASRWLGKGYSELAPGVYRSSDGLRQFRMTSADLKGAHGNIGSHVHFEALDGAGRVVENLHLGIKP